MALFIFFFDRQIETVLSYIEVLLQEERIMGVDHEKIEQAVRMILEAVGEDPDREGLVDTPKRVARMYEEVFAGLRTDPREYFTVVFGEEHEELVLVKDISFFLCLRASFGAVFRGSPRRVYSTRRSCYRAEQACEGSRGRITKAPASRANYVHRGGIHYGNA